MKRAVTLLFYTVSDCGLKQVARLEAALKYSSDSLKLVANMAFINKKRHEKGRK